MNVRLFTLLTLVVLLSACGGGDLSDLEKFIAEEKSKSNFPNEPLPDFPAAHTFFYQSESLRDPFLPLQERVVNVSDDVSAEINCPRPDLHRQKEDLEQYALDSLEMKGVFRQEDDETFALIEDPRGTIHPIRVNNHLGLNHGEVILIEPQLGYLELREMIPNEEGCFREQISPIKMQRNN